MRPPPKMPLRNQSAADGLSAPLVFPVTSPSAKTRNSPSPNKTQPCCTRKPCRSRDDNSRWRVSCNSPCCRRISPPFPSVRPEPTGPEILQLLPVPSAGAGSRAATSLMFINLHGRNRRNRWHFHLRDVMGHDVRAALVTAAMTHALLGGGFLKIRRGGRSRPVAGGHEPGLVQGFSGRLAPTMFAR